MPSLPTSLSVVALVVAWLVVLVPMAARRREHVPHSDERSAGFRILRRSSRRRNRRVLSRTAVASPDDTDEWNAGEDTMDDRFDESEFDDDMERDEYDGDANDAEGAGSVASTVGAEGLADEDELDDDEAAGDDRVDGDLAEALFDVDDDLDDDDVDDELADDLVGADEAGGAVGSTSADAYAQTAHDTDPDPAEFADPAEIAAASPGRSAEASVDPALDPVPEPAVAAGDPRGQGRLLAARSRSDWQAASELPLARDGERDLGADVGRDADTAVGDDWDAADEWAAEHAASVTKGGHGQRSDPDWSGDRSRTAPGSGGRGDEPRPGTRTTGATVNAAGRPADEPEPADPEMEGVDPAALRPVPRRPGRGGFDPEAAATAKVFRYRRRRRVTVFLLLATIAFTLVSVFLAPTAWIGAVVSGVLLIGYLTYLRRQVRIEESIRQRRMARLARARQIRPDYGRDAYGRDVYGRDHGDRDHYGSGASLREPDGPAQAADHRSARRGMAADTLVAAASVPPSPRSGTVVDLDDDDPAFAELEYHRPLTYRRASGQ